MINSAYYVAII